MESMKSLNSSLPPKQEDLRQVFKNAALSLTNLYRTAEASEGRSRQAGYQDALDELLAFLDSENIGLDDGEGWKIRQWATARLDGQPNPRAGSESEEEKPEAMKRIKETVSAKDKRVAVEPEQLKQVQEQTPAPSDSPTTSSESTNATNHQREIFTFRSGHSYPSDMELASPELAKVELSPAEHRTQAQSPPAVTVNVFAQGSKTPRSSRTVQRTSSRRTLGSGAGSKRKVTFDDFFDVDSLEGSGSGKRGRLS